MEEVQELAETEVERRNCQDGLYPVGSLERAHHQYVAEGDAYTRA